MVGEQWAGRRVLRQVGRQGLDDRWGERDDAARLRGLGRPERVVLQKLALDAHLAAQEVDVFDVEPEGLSDAQATTGKQHNEASEPIVDVLDHRCDLLRRRRGDLAVLPLR